MKDAIKEILSGLIEQDARDAKERHAFWEGIKTRHERKENQWEA